MKDHERHSSLTSTKACEWVLAKKCENAEDDGKVTQAERLDYNAIPIHTLGEKVSFIQVLHIAVLYIKNSHIASI